MDFDVQERLQSCCSEHHARSQAALQRYRQEESEAST